MFHHLNFRHTIASDLCRRVKFWLAVILLSISPLPAQAQSVDLEQLFNAGVNLGWLGASFESGLEVANRPVFSANFAAHFNAGYPFREINPPGTTQSGVGYVYSTATHWLSQHAPGTIGPARSVLQAGTHLGWGQIWAQKGTCPGCVKNMLYKAGLRLENVGAELNSGAIIARGQRLKSLAQNFRAQNQEQVMVFEPEFANAIAFMQESL